MTGVQTCALPISYHHVALNFLTLLRDDPMNPIDTSPIEGDDALPPLRAPEAAWEACCERLGADPAWRASAPIVVVNPNAGDMALERRWPAERVAEFLVHLSARRDLNLVAFPHCRPQPGMPHGVRLEHS